ncbi:MAG: low-complexity tail membrane protein, partial [Synechococcus sp.]
MSPRREPLLWLQCLALGAIPLELLLIRLLLAGADPGPVPGIERLLLWGVGVVAPAVALWKRPADWGSLLLVRRPTNGRGAEQQQLSSAQSNRLSGFGAVTAAVVLLPLLWWLDDSAVLVGEFSPVSSQSRLVTLLLSTPLLAVIVWQVQQLVQASTWLITDQITTEGDGTPFSTTQLMQERSSFGLQLLELPPLTWPDPAAKPSPDAPSVETPSVSAAVAIEPDQAAEESEGASLD